MRGPKIALFRWRMVVLMLALAAPRVALADIFPGDMIASMAKSVELVVEGTWIKGEIVRVNRVLKQSSREEVLHREIRVSYVDLHDRRFDGPFANRDTPEVMTRRVVLFLNWSKEDAAWIPLHTIQEDNCTGSCGLFWFDGRRLYGYVQSTNPGPYCLVAGQPADELGAHARIPDGIDALRQTVKVALENAGE